jgi:DNA polymerase-3 subunit alpha
MDILGVETLSVIQNVQKLIERNRGTKIDVDAIPLDDRRAFELLHQGFVKGVFQLEISRSARDMILQMKPSTVDDIMAAVALNRPGPMQSGMVEMYIRRKHGQEKVTFPHPDLESILKETYGAILYQEQVMLIANRLAGFTLAEADKLRKAMGKKIPELMAKFKDKFLDGCKKHHVDAKVAESIWEDMSKFAAYGFNKSHSAAYGLIAYRTAYLKANFPLEFMAVLMTTNLHDEDKLTEYIEECRRMNIHVLPPDINESEYEFKVSGADLRMGLGAVKNVGERPIQAMLEARRGLGRPFASFFEFVDTVDLSQVDKRAVEFLIKAGSFDSMKLARAHLMNTFEEILKIANKKREEKASGQLNIFMSASDPNSGYPEFESIPEWPQDVLLKREKEALGFYITSNPVARYSSLIDILPTVSIDSLEGYQGDRESIRLAGIVTNVRLKVVQNGPRKGARYVVFDFSDLTGRIESVMFASDLERNEKNMKEDAIVLLSGTLDDRNDQPSIIARDLVPLEDAATLFQGVFIEMNPDDYPPEKIDALYQALRANRGTTPVSLVLHKPGSPKRLGRLPEDYNVKMGRELVEALLPLVGPRKIRVELAKTQETTRLRRRWEASKTPQ